MGLFSRFAQIVKADMHGVMDQFEDKELLLKQYLREMEVILAEKEAALKKLTNLLSRIQEQAALHQKEAAKIDADLATALSKEKDEIAKMLIKKLKPVSHLIQTSENQKKAVAQDINALSDEISIKKQQLDEFKLKYLRYQQRMEHQKWGQAEKDLFGDAVFKDTEFTDEEIELELIKRKEKLSKEESYGSK